LTRTKFEHDELTLRPLRRDAAENREQILDGAAKVFASQGLGASMDEIARFAGVGMGTIYRRFPTKEALIDELVRQQLVEIAAAADRALELPEGGLEAFLWDVGEILARRRGCLSRLWVGETNAKLIETARAGIAKLLERGQEAGSIREDAVPSDISLVIWSLFGVIDTTHEVAPSTWRRGLELSIAALRAGGEPLRSASPSRRQMREIARRVPLPRG
jgi:AcrR family transcriptional regulator